jgi:F-type H+-transporting ATPase subunit epsilon
MRISHALQEELLTEEEQLHTMKQSLHRMEEEILNRLWEMGRKELG